MAAECESPMRNTTFCGGFARGAGDRQARTHAVVRKAHLLVEEEVRPSIQGELLALRRWNKAGGAWQVRHCLRWSTAGTAHMPAAALSTAVVGVDRDSMVTVHEGNRGMLTPGVAVGAAVGACVGAVVCIVVGGAFIVLLLFAAAGSGCGAVVGAMVGDGDSIGDGDGDGDGGGGIDRDGTGDGARAAQEAQPDLGADEQRTEEGEDGPVALWAPPTCGAFDHMVQQHGSAHHGGDGGPFVRGPVQSDRPLVDDKRWPVPEVERTAAHGPTRQFAARNNAHGADDGEERPGEREAALGRRDHKRQQQQHHRHRFQGKRCAKRHAVERARDAAVGFQRHEDGSGHQLPEARW
eukprot:7390267-Prymnesium_polylepis.2